MKINSLFKLYLNSILTISGVLSASSDSSAFNNEPYVQSNYPLNYQPNYQSDIPPNIQHTSAEFFKIFHIPYVAKLNLIDEHVKQVKSDVRKVDSKLESLNKNYESLLTTTNLIYNRLLDFEIKLNEILMNTKAKLNSSKNQNINFQYQNTLRPNNRQNAFEQNQKKMIANQRVLVGRSISNDDYNHDFVNEFIQNVFNWQNKTDLKMTKIMNVITEIYREDKQLSLDLSKLNERQTNEDRIGLVERMQKEFKEQFSINKAELKSYIGNVNENCLRTKTQNENLTFLLLGLKDDLNNPLKSSTKFNQENSVLPPDDESEKHPLVDAGLINKSELFCKATNNLINTTIEQFRTDLTNVKQQILNKLDRENTRINERIYTLNNNYQHLNNLRNCNSSIRNLGQSNGDLLNSVNNPLNTIQDSSSNEIDSTRLFKTTNTISTSTFIPPFYQVPRKRDEDSRIRSSNTRTKLINPIKNGSTKKKSCYSPNIMSPANCEDLYLDRVNCDGIYVILFKEEATRIYCEIDDTSGSTIIMRRGQFNDYTLTKFNQNWYNYKRGFGNLDADFWLGLDKIHELTKNKNQMLEINLESFDGQQITLRFNQFYIDDESNNYKLTIGESILNQNYADLFLKHNGAYFVTSDRNDRRNCARKFEAGWWFLDTAQCHSVLLNGVFYQNSVPMQVDGIQWSNWPSTKKQYLKAVQMKIRDRKTF